jgi:hypothetical protein
MGVDDSIRGHESVHKGTATEAHVTADLIDLRAIVLRPFDSNPDYDLVIQVGVGHPWKRFLSIQCKSGRLHDDGTWEFKTADNKGRTYRGRVDLIAAYTADRTLLIRPEEVGKVVYIRSAPTKNKQRKKIRMVEDYDAQLVLMRLVEQWRAEYETQHPEV